MESASPDVIVVGAGITGAGTAFHLARRGVRTTLLERGYPAAGPSGHSPAVLHSFYLSRELSLLAERGIDVFRHLEEWTGHSTGFVETGTMWACGPNLADEYQTTVERMNNDGIAAEALDPETIRQMAPHFDLDGIKLAVWEPRAGYADSSTATNSLVRAAADAGANVLMHTRAVRLVVEGSRVTGVETDRGERLSAGVVVLAAGLWSRQLAATVNVTLPTFGERHILGFAHVPGRAQELLPFAWVDDIQANYARPVDRNIILVGTWAGGGTGHRNEAIPRASAVDEPDSMDSMESVERSATIVNTLTARIPELSQYSARPAYAGLYDMSPDDNPIHSWVSDMDGLFLAVGTSGHGFKLGPGVGAAIADAIVDGDDAVLRPFQLSRFAS